MTRRREYFKITKLARTYNRKTGKFTFNIAYETTTTITPRTKNIAEAFGLGIDQTQKFILYDNVELKIAPTDIILITGDSGSGKSVLLRAIKQDLAREALDSIEMRVDEDKPIIDTIGKTFNKALELLTKVGLNDAFLFLRRYNELSDGQKYRYRLAKLMESGRQWWVMDEFCSVLDRDTAKIVAFNVQKVARRDGKAVIAATTHMDLFEDFRPSVHVHKRFGKEVIVNYFANVLADECSLVRDVRVEEGVFADYKRLSVFHYRGSRCPPPRKIFRLVRKDELCGVIVYGCPPPFTVGRSRVWKGDFEQLQREVSTITRVIVHPKYRSTGLGVKLVRETLPLAGTPCVETLAVMARYNPFFEKAGMQKVVESKPSGNVLGAIECLRGLGFDPVMLGSVSQNLCKIKLVGKGRVVEVLEELSRKEGSVRKRLVGSGRVYPSQRDFVEKVRGLDEEGLAAALKRLAFLAQSKVYLFWSRMDGAVRFGEG